MWQFRGKQFFPDRIRFNGSWISLLLQPKEEDQSVYKRSKLLILLIFYVYSVDNLFFIYCTVTFICVQNRLHFNEKDLKYVNVESLTDVNTFS